MAWWYVGSQHNEENIVPATILQFQAMPYCIQYTRLAENLLDERTDWDKELVFLTPRGSTVCGYRKWVDEGLGSGRSLSYCLPGDVRQIARRMGQATDPPWVSSVYLAMQPQWYNYESYILYLWPWRNNGQQVIMVDARSIKLLAQLPSKRMRLAFRRTC